MAVTEQDMTAQLEQFADIQRQLRQLDDEYTRTLQRAGLREQDLRLDLQEMPPESRAALLQIVDAIRKAVDLGMLDPALVPGLAHFDGKTITYAR